MQIELTSVPQREVLHFLGWRGTPVEPELLAQIDALSEYVINKISPRVAVRRFFLGEGCALQGTSFVPGGDDVAEMLRPCSEAVLLAATLGAQTERMLLREQALSPESALILDAVLSAAIEAVCDQAEHALRADLINEGLYLTDRFSPGYGDMPVVQTRDICAVLDAPRSIGLTVSSAGIMIPRKSVTAIMGIASAPVTRRASRCALCSAREYCKMRRNGE